MVNPRWRPTIANSRQTTKSKQKNTIKQLVKVVNFVISDESGNGSSIKCDNGYF